MGEGVKFNAKELPRLEGGDAKGPFMQEPRVDPAGINEAGNEQCVGPHRKAREYAGRSTTCRPVAPIDTAEK